MPIQYNHACIHSIDYPMNALQDTARLLLDRGVPIINATVGDPMDDTPAPIRETLMASLNRQSHSQYPLSGGSDALRHAAVTAIERDYGVSLNATQCVTCNGTKEAIFSLPLLFDWSHGGVVLIPSMSYPVYAMSARYFGATIVTLPLVETHQFLPDLAAIPRDILRKTQLFWINSPHNPTTTQASRDYLNELVALAEAYDFLIASDECYADLYEGDRPASIMDVDSPNWVCFRSLSKRSHMTGYRSGVMVSKNESFMTYVKKMRHPMGVGTPTWIQDAATWAWQDVDHVRHHRAHYNQKRTRIREALSRAGCTVFGGEAGFYMWVRHDECSSSQALSQWFLDRHILVTPGTVFGDDGDPYVRLVFCLRDDTISAMIRALEPTGGG